MDFQEIVDAVERAEEERGQSADAALRRAEARKRCVYALVAGAEASLGAKVKAAIKDGQKSVVVLRWTSGTGCDEAEEAATRLESNMRTLGIGTSRGAGEIGTGYGAGYELYVDVADVVRVARARTGRDVGKPYVPPPRVDHPSHEMVMLTAEEAWDGVDDGGGLELRGREGCKRCKAGPGSHVASLPCRSPATQGARS